jgi:ribosomal protein S18 acetylase RimI-like enzyme
MPRLFNLLLAMPKELQITYGEINNNNINQVRKLNYDTLPVKYSTGFYYKLMTEYTTHSRAVYYNDIMIGCYTVRVEDYEGVQAAYILTFVVLEPYRKFKIGTKMMENLENDIRKVKDVKCIYLHMHVQNQVGRQFYERCGFKIEKRLDNYYTDL